MQFGNRLFVLLGLGLASAWLIGCGASGAPMLTPTASFATRTFTPTNTPTFTPTNIPTPTPTNPPTPTSTPASTPTPTRPPIPTPTPPPGWKKLESTQIELWAPDSFVGGDPIKDKESILKSLRAFGSEYVASAKILDQNPPLFAFYATDSKLGSTGFITSISVTANQIVSTGTVETLQGGVNQQLPSQYTVLDRRLAMLTYYSAERMVTDSPMQGRRMRQLVYTIKSLNTAWVVAFSTVDDEFFARLPAFEQSMLTFKIKP